jgi:PleD family two-component response regulator
MPAHLTCSAGIAWWDGRESATEPISRADRALYRAKASGRDRVEMDGRELVPEA